MKHFEEIFGALLAVQVPSNVSTKLALFARCFLKFILLVQEQETGELAQKLREKLSYSFIGYFLV